MKMPNVLAICVRMGNPNAKYCNLNTCIIGIFHLILGTPEASETLRLTTLQPTQPVLFPDGARGFVAQLCARESQPDFRRPLDYPTMYTVRLGESYWAD